jgi:ATP-dependent Clp protease ATP-binding subunit ClpA
VAHDPRLRQALRRAPDGRLVQEKIKQPLAEELLFGKLIHGGEVKVTIKDNTPSFEIISAPPKAKRKGKKTAEPAPDESGESDGQDQPEAQA